MGWSEGCLPALSKCMLPLLPYNMIQRRKQDYVPHYDLVIRFLGGARRSNPPWPHLVPSWDLPSVLTALKEEPIKPLHSEELKCLSLKTVLLTALTSVKRVGDLQAFAVDDSCRDFGPVTLTLS